MKIEIETKFDISDIVWTAEYTGDEIGFKPIKNRILTIDVQIFDKALRCIRYFLCGDDTSYDESQLFATKEECQAKCDRLNKGAHE